MILRTLSHKTRMSIKMVVLNSPICSFSRWRYSDGDQDLLGWLVVEFRDNTTDLLSGIDEIRSVG